MQGMKSLYVFGHNPIQQDSRQDPRHNVPILQAPSLSVLWVSWCDLIVAHSNSKHLVYHGTSLTAAQAEYITRLPYPSPESEAPIFFGRALDHGVLGFLTPSGKEVTIFNSDAKCRDKNTAAVATVSFQDANFEILDIQFTSGEAAFVSLKLNRGSPDGMRTTDLDDNVILQFPTLQNFLEFLKQDPHLLEHQMNPHRSDSSLPFRVLACPYPIQLRTNATTLAALTSISGEVHTFSPDPRFPKCLGRHASCTAEAEPIPYLSEIRVGKIASGGYYTCAVSASVSCDSHGEDGGGELFLWGQAPPGTNQEISLLRSTVSSDDQDDFVCCVELEIGDITAGVTDVAVGWGHVLVAVEATQGTERKVSRTVFAAGCNGRQQLGLGGKSGTLGFLNQFTEVEILKEKRIVQMACSGWSSYIVTEDDDEGS
ncbi:hypothetical protein DM02DRAFT_730201 [Periconia macrospinosa]|uniref:Uncharacterized protein n=1 Tax=Periconia macrospinosa TaxID=97972 RepID=A0A2V1DJ53_9PLEO|nr:hypothetical protein DM02DRAFT_730201 [Periconia macrospinosa]